MSLIKSEPMAEFGRKGKPRCQRVGCGGSCAAARTARLRLMSAAASQRMLQELPEALDVS